MAPFSDIGVIWWWSDLVKVCEGQEKSGVKISKAVVNQEMKPSWRVTYHTKKDNGKVIY